MEMDVAELAGDKGALGPLEVVGRSASPGSHRPGRRFARQTWRYRFAPQDYDIGLAPTCTTPRSTASSRTRSGATGRCAQTSLAIDDGDVDGRPGLAG